MTTLGEGITRPLDIAANLAQVATGVDDQQVRDELAATRGAVTNAIDFAVNGDYAQAAKNVHQAAVDETVKALEGDVTATSNVTQGVLAAALVKGGPKGKGKPRITEENPAGPGGKTSNINPDLQKRADAFRAYKESKGLGQSDKVTSEQFRNFKRGNAGDSGKKLYAPKSKYKDPQVKQHGNTLNSEKTEIYVKRDAQGNYQKTGIAKEASERYSDAEIAGGSVDVIGTRPRSRAAKLERFMVERKPGPQNKEPWAGKRDPSHPNYDPDYVPPHMRK